MTRSIQSKYSPKVTKKAFRQTARALNLTYPQALAAREEARHTLNRDGQPMKMLQPPTSGGRTGGRRNPGRMDGMAWKADSFICPEHVVGNVHEIEGAPQILEYEEDLLKADIIDHFVEDDDTTPGVVDQKVTLETLVENARMVQTKGKGLARQLDYEVLNPTSRVICLNENEFMIGGSSMAGLVSETGLNTDADDSDGDSDWENLYDDDFVVMPRASAGKKMSYAAVLKTKG